MPMLLLALTSILWSLAIASLGQLVPAPGGAQKVREAPRVVVTAGSPLRGAGGAGPCVLLPVRCGIAKGWHLYWQNSGTSGMAPQVTVEAPSGWTAGPLVFPRPEVLVHGEEVTFGYEEQVTYLVPLTPGAGAQGGNASVRIKYLVCREACESGEATLSFALPGADGLAQLPAAGDSIEGRRLPVPIATAGGKANMEGSTIRVLLPAEAGRGFRFLPFDRPGFSLADGKPFQRGEAGKDGLLQVQVKVEPKEPGGPDLPIGGLVLLGTGRDDPCLTVELPRAGR